LRFLSSQWLKAGVSLTLFAILLGSSDLHVFMQHIAAARLDFFLLAFLGYLFGQTLSAYKWRMLAQPLGFDQPLRTFAVYYFVGMYLNLFAPGTVVGDLGRGVLLAQDKGGIGPALQSVLADRVSGVVMLLWVSAAGFILFGPTVLPLALCYGTVATAFLAIAGWWALPHVMPLFCSPGQWLYRLVDKVILPYRARTALLAGVCGLSFTFHLFQLGLQMLLAHALGLTVPVWYLVLFIPLVNILSYLPLSFTGAGVREGGYVFFLSLVGIAKEEALAFGLLWTAMLFATGLCGGVVLLLSSEARFSLRRTEAMADGSPMARGEELKRTMDG
jgi:glycosyltransferase 2 family protein